MQAWVRGVREAQELLDHKTGQRYSKAKVWFAALVAQTCPGSSICLDSHLNNVTSVGSITSGTVACCHSFSVGPLLAVMQAAVALMHCLLWWSRWLQITQLQSIKCFAQASHIQSRPATQSSMSPVAQHTNTRLFFPWPKCSIAIALLHTSYDLPGEFRYSDTNYLSVAVAGLSSPLSAFRCHVRQQQQADSTLRLSPTAQSKCSTLAADQEMPWGMLDCLFATEELLPAMVLSSVLKISMVVQALAGWCLFSLDEAPPSGSDYGHMHNALCVCPSSVLVLLSVLIVCSCWSLFQVVMLADDYAWTLTGQSCLCAM